MLNNCKSGHLISDQTKNVPVLLSTSEIKNILSHEKNTPSTSQQEQMSTAHWYFCSLGLLVIRSRNTLCSTDCVVFLYFTVNSGCYSVRMDFRQPYKFSQLCLVATNLLASARKFFTSITPHYNKEATSCVKNKCHL